MITASSATQLTRSANFKFDGTLLTVGGFGSHAFSAGGAGFNQIQIANTTSGAANGALIKLTGGLTNAYLQALSQGYTSSGPNQASSLLLYGDSAGGISIYAGDAAGQVRIYTGGTSERARWLSTGQVVLNAAAAVLNGWQTTSFDGVSYNGIVLNDTTGSSGLSFAVFALSGVSIGSITRNAATSAVLYNTTSDYRLKELFGRFTAAAALLRGLVVHDARWKGADQRQPVLVAHEVQPVTPWVVQGEKDAVDAAGQPRYQQLAVGGHEALLIAGWQDLDARVAALERGAHGVI